MQPVRDFDALTADLAIWHDYDVAAKTELYSSYLRTAAGAYLVDPIPLHKSVLDQLTGSSCVAGIVVTNANHHRLAAQLAQQLSVPVLAHADTFTRDQAGGFTTIADGEKICDGLRVIAIEGAVPGEIALHCEDDRGTLVVGDAVINFEPYGFALLPAKYCANQKQMRRSLRKLLEYKAERILFAHGMPILSGADQWLRTLLESDVSM